MEQSINNKLNINWNCNLRHCVCLSNIIISKSNFILISIDNKNHQNFRLVYSYSLRERKLETYLTSIVSVVYTIQYIY